jgi:hypothetical protein
VLVLTGRAAEAARWGRQALERYERKGSVVAARRAALLVRASAGG